MRVLFIQPNYPLEQRFFARGLAAVGAEVIGVGDSHAPDPAVEDALAAYLRVPHLRAEERAARTIADAVRHLQIDRVESLWEPTVLLAARMRELLGVDGMSRDTVLGFRDKVTMRERCEAAGVRVPKSRRASTVGDARRAAAEIGFPLVVKPIAGAGSADTYRCDDAAELEDVLRRTGHVPEISIEEFIDGEEFTCDTVCIDGKPVFESVSRYSPRPLVFRSEQWISPAQVTFRDPHRADLMPGVELGRQVVRALGMGTGFTHMEWYRKADGEVVLGEIGCRNGGGHLVDMMNWANDFDIYTEWARAVCHGEFAAEPARRYHVGMVFKRAMGEGRITRVEGREMFRAAAGQWLVADELSPVGAHRRDWKATLVSDGFVAVRHPELGKVHALMDRAIDEIRLYAGG